MTIELGQKSDNYADLSTSLLHSVGGKSVENLDPKPVAKHNCALEDLGLYLNGDSDFPQADKEPLV